MLLTGPAAARLYDDHVDAVHRYVSRRLGPELADDVVATTFTSAVSSDGPPGITTELERTWLLGIASRLLRRHDDVERSRLQAWQQPTAAPTVGNPLDPLVAGDAHANEIDAVMHAAAELDPDDRDVLFLVIWERYPHATVARALGVSTGSVGSALKRIRRELRRGAKLVDEAVGPDHGEDTAS